MPTYTNETYDGVCTALLGNGAICTTVGATGYHTPPEMHADAAHRTQHFVWAGRRLAGPRHPLLNFGSLSRTLYVSGARVTDGAWRQELNPQTGIAVSRLDHPNAVETTLSCVPMGSNCLVAETRIECASTCEVRFDLVLTAATDSPTGRPTLDCDAVAVPVRSGDHLGTLRLVSRQVGGPWPSASCTRSAIRLSHHARVAPDHPMVVRTILQFSDRGDFSFPLGLEAFDDVLATSAAGWGAFHARSRVVTGNADVDRFRAISMYTLRAQLTDWSIGPTLSEPYWGGGAFHDEMYPFFALMSANHPELADRMPRFRLRTLPAALRRARGLGALYPWSSTEDGEERDPEGLWLTERFHLAQFSAQIWAQWLYGRDLGRLREYYPVLREIARYLQATVVERDASGAVGTRSCVDFDESVGAIRNGPFTVSGSAAALRWAADAADLLHVDAHEAARGRDLSRALLSAIPVALHSGDEVFGIPDGAPLHYSVLGHIFPFGCEAASERAIRTARWVQAALRSTRGWKPGMSDAFEDSNWTWTSGHLGIVHAMHGEAERAWEAVSVGISGSGPGPTPVEHLDGQGVPRVPWFTTGVGAWLYAMHAGLVWVAEDCNHLLSAAPAMPACSEWDHLRGSHGVTLSGRTTTEGGALVTARAPNAVAAWRYSVPKRMSAGVTVHGAVVAETATATIHEIPLTRDCATVLVSPRPSP